MHSLIFPSKIWAKFALYTAKYRCIYIYIKSHICLKCSTVLGIKCRLNTTHRPSCSSCFSLTHVTVQSSRAICCSLQGSDILLSSCLPALLFLHHCSLGKFVFRPQEPSVTLNLPDSPRQSQMSLPLCLWENTPPLGMTRTSSHQSASPLWWLKYHLPADLSVSATSLPLGHSVHWRFTVPHSCFRKPLLVPLLPHSTLMTRNCFFLLYKIRFEKQFARIDASCIEVPNVYVRNVFKTLKTPCGTSEMITGGFRVQSSPSCTPHPPVSTKISNSLMEQECPGTCAWRHRECNTCLSFEVSGFLWAEQSGPFSLAIRHCPTR